MDKRTTLLLTLTILMSCLSLFGCNPLKDAIAVSNATLDFGLNELPLPLQVWNNNTDAGSFDITVRTTAPWIVTDVNEVTADPPSATGVLSKQTIQVSIDRRGLAAGTYEGKVRLTAPGINTVTVTVRAQQPEGGDAGALNVIKAGYTYSEPYLVDFQFSLEDALGNAVVAEPAQFDIVAQEGNSVVGLETGVHLRRGAARQLKIDLVLDYTLSMQSVTGAIAAMEDAAKNILLPALNQDAQVGILEFHRDDAEPGRVAEFTVERDTLEARIDAIQNEFVNGFYSGSRTWDAVFESARGFGAGEAAEEDRYIILFSDGTDTSSTHTRNQAVEAANNRGIHIYAVGFGLNVDEGSLIDLTQRTGGDYFSADSVGELDDTFQGIVNNLGAQYTLRWATLRRNSVPFYPSFTISLDGAEDTYTADTLYVATLHADGPEQALEGRLRIVPSYVDNRATVFLRAEYVPRFIDTLSLFVRSQRPYTVAVVNAEDDGLLDGWDVQITEDAENGGVWIDAVSEGDPIPFATFGPLLRFSFGEIEDDAIPLFDGMAADNTVYANGQSFVIEGFSDTAPVRSGG